jgi:hypothetical protein
MPKKKFLGFYWTLPVPWAGFKALPLNVDDAAELSRTIRYQRDLVRRWVKLEGGELVAEEVFLELEPDRSSVHISYDLDRAIKRCRTEEAALVLVDFASSFGSRRHYQLWRELSDSDVEHMSLEPEPILIDGKKFDPVKHFRAWQSLQDDYTNSKPERKAAVVEAIKKFDVENSSNVATAEALNASGLTTTTGKPWTADNLRKFKKTFLTLFR